MSPRRRRHQWRTILIGMIVLAAADMFAWVLVILWRLAPVVVPVAALAGGVWWLRRRGVRLPSRAPKLIRGHVIDDGHAEQLHAELTRLRAQVNRLEDVANRPIDAIIASYEAIASRYGDAAVGKTGRQP